MEPPLEHELTLASSNDHQPTSIYFDINLERQKDIRINFPDILYGLFRGKNVRTMADAQEPEPRNSRPGSPRNSDRPIPKLLVHRFSYPQLLAIPVLLTVGYIATIITLSLQDVNPGLLYSQCHARAKVPWLSHIPLLGAPACYLVSFFQYAVSSFRSAAILSEILAFIGALLTVTTLEAARLCNASATLIANPTGPWLMFNLAGGQVVWGLVIVPAFVKRAKGLEAVERSGEDRLAADSRNVALGVEAIAVPMAVLLGFFVPSLVMLFNRSSVAVFVWLFFPVYVAIVRQFVRWVLVRADAEKYAPPFRVEQNRGSISGVYLPAVLFSVFAHVWVIFSLFKADDRKEMTRSCLGFIQIDALFIAATALYWIMVEGGWKSAAVAVLVSVVLGPGAGLCAAWVTREFVAHGAVMDATERVDNGQPNEETPLLG